MKPTPVPCLALVVAVGITVCATVCAQSGSTIGWLNWRGPLQAGVSLESDLVTECSPGAPTELWTYPIAGRGAPVIADGRLYTMAYQGEGPDLHEVLLCLDAATGARLWEARFNDFLSDTTYSRYAIGSPTVDAETGHIYVLSSPGVFACYTPEGRQRWRVSMMEEYGRLTFPNGRTGAPVIDDDLVILHAVTSNWGAEGPGRDRFYAFDKHTGRLVWSSTPGIAPKDSSFSTGVLRWEGKTRVFYVGTGCGHIAAINARTGEPIWRFPLSAGGINASPVLYKDTVIALHDAENLDTSETGRMVAVRVGTQRPAGATDAVVLGREAEVWRNPLGIFTSSPTLAGNRVYQLIKTGELCCVNADTGEVLWRLKLAPDQLHASPLFADGKLYVPMHNGMLYVIKPSDAGGEILHAAQLEGECLGAPSVWDGRIYVHTTAKLYCFGRPDAGERPPVSHAEPEAPAPGPPAALQVVPAEVLLRPGDTTAITVRAIDAEGLFVEEITDATWRRYVPLTARVQSFMDGEFIDSLTLRVPVDATSSAGAFEALWNGLRGTMRGRVLPALPMRETFDGFALSVAHETEPGVMFAYPPLPWIGARFKWEVRDIGGEKALAKTLDNILFQRAITFIGHPEMRNYTMQADVMSDGNRRNMSNVGLVNQRYIIALIGNWQQIEVSSNHDLIKVGAPFKWQPGVWYRLKTRVDVAADGSGVVRGKAWNRDEPEPEAWTIEAPHAHAHEEGAPGIYGFSLQSQFRVYIDNITVTPND